MTTIHNEDEFKAKVEALTDKIMKTNDAEDYRVIMTAMAIAYLSMYDVCMSTEDEDVMEHADHVSQQLTMKMFEQRTGVSIEQVAGMIEKEVTHAVEQ